MALKKAENIDTNLYQLEIAVDGDKFNDAVTKVFNRQKKNISIPGFRKGKAPRGMIEKYYGEGVFYNDAFEQLFPEVVTDAVEEAGIEIVDNPYDVDIQKMDKDGVEFSLKVTVKPDVELDDYKGLSAKKPVVEVTDEDVQSEIDAMLERSARFVERRLRRSVYRRFACRGARLRDPVHETVQRDLGRRHRVAERDGVAVAGFFASGRTRRGAVEPGRSLACKRRRAV